MSLNIFDKMLVRFTALVISVLYFQVSCSQQNGSNILSNLVLNNSVGIQSHGNIIQNSLNQFSTNRVLSNSVQQTANFQKSQNVQSQGTQQGGNVQQLVNLQTLNSQQPLNLHSVSTQHPNNLESVTTQQPMRLQSVNSQQSQNFQLGNMHKTLSLQSERTQQHRNQQQSLLSIQPSGSLQQSLPLQQPIQQTSLHNRNNQQSNIMQNQNPSLSNTQLLNQASDVSSSPINEYIQTYQEINVPSCLSLTSTPDSTTLCLNNSGGESVSVMYPQNQQVSISGIPSYVIDTPQTSNTGPSTMAYTTSYGNQPTLLTVLAVPQQHQQSIDIVHNSGKNAQSQTDKSNQVTIIKSVQPHSSATSTAKQDPNLISVLSPVANQASPASYSALLPTVSSILASKLSKQSTKSSNLNALLPLIFNLIKERSTCGCSHHCGCSKNTHSVNDHDEEEYRSYPKRSRHSYKRGPSKYSNDYSDEYEDHGRYENRRNSKRYGKNRNVKPESVESSKEYDYSDEFHEDN